MARWARRLAHFALVVGFAWLAASALRPAAVDTWQGLSQPGGIVPELVPAVLEERNGMLRPRGARDSKYQWYLVLFLVMPGLTLLAVVLAYSTFRRRD